MRNVNALLFATLLLAGCGGGGGSSNPGSGGGGTTSKNKGIATLTVQWPARGRLIPLAANSLVATLSLDGSVVASKTIVRPTDGAAASATFDGLAYGTYVVGARAYPSGDGSGVAQGIGTGSVVVEENVPGAVGLALSSTVARLAVVSSAPAFPKGTSLGLGLSATDADGNIVLLSANGGTEAVAWSADAPTNATLTPSGLTATLASLHSGTVSVIASMVVNDAGGVLTSAPLPLTITPVNDGSTTVTLH